MATPSLWLLLGLALPSPASSPSAPPQATPSETTPSRAALPPVSASSPAALPSIAAPPPPFGAAPGKVGEPERLRIGTHEVSPFSYPAGAGWDGLSIALLRRIADREGFTFELEPMPLDRLIGATTEGRVDAAVAALTITAEREATVDFGHPFLVSGLGVAARASDGATGFGLLFLIFSSGFLETAGALVLLLLAVGALIWVVERKRNPQFASHPVTGLGAGFWWSAVTMTTVGYGDKAPVTALGRLVAVIWMFASVILISSFTAAIATSLTVGELEGRVRSLDDLRRCQVVVPGESASAGFLRAERVRHRTVPTLDRALAAVAAGEADAVVYDRPILQDALRRHPEASHLALLPLTLARQDYGFAFPSGSPRRERWNRVLLEVVESPGWPELVNRYLADP